jgi:hypothetical protein
VPEYAYDPAYSTCSFCSEVYPVEFLPGPEHMDGDRALAYARIRKSDDDFHRIERQQLVLTAMARKAMSTDAILNNPIGLYNQFKDAVETNISDVRAGGLALLMQDIGAENIRTVSMAPATFPCQTCPAAVLEWNRTKMEELKALVFSDVRLGQEDASIEVLNGTVTPDLAATFASEMRVNGIQETRITTDEYADNLIYPNTLIIDVSGTDGTTVQKLSDWLGLPASRLLTASDPEAAQFLDTTADIVVVLGEDVQVGFGGDVTVVTAQAGG